MFAWGVRRHAVACCKCLLLTQSGHGLGLSQRRVEPLRCPVLRVGQANETAPKADIKRICLRPATWWRKPMIYRPRLIGSWRLALCKPRDKTPTGFPPDWLKQTLT